MVTLREKLQAALTQPHWQHDQPAGIVRASVSDLTTDILYAVDEFLHENGYEALRKLVSK